jgi:RimJ/RimL family protein N-acetyltransferase
MPVLTGDGFVLRPFRAGDEASLARAGNNPNVARNLVATFPSPYTLEAAQAWVASCASPPPGETRFAIEVDGAVHGGIGIHQRPLWSPYTYEMGYWLAEPLWGRGLMTKVVAQAVKYGFTELRAERVQSYVYDWNTGSQRVLEKNGFRLEGRLRRAVFRDGRWADCLAYGRLKTD